MRRHPKADDPADLPDELRPLPVALPSDLDIQLGYDGDGRYVAVWWIGDHLTISDGYVSGSGHDWTFIEFDRAAGRQVLTTAADESAEHDRDDIPEYPVRLTDILLDMGYDLGSADTRGNAALLLDRDTGTLYVGAVDHVRAFCRRFNDTPEWVDALPADPENVMNVFERLAERVADDQDDDPFGDDSEEGSA